MRAYLFLDVQVKKWKEKTRKYIALSCHIIIRPCVFEVLNFCAPVTAHIICGCLNALPLTVTT